MQRLFYYPGFVNNLGFIKSSNTFIIKGADGRNLTSGTTNQNQANLVLPDRTNEGYSRLIQGRANRSFVDAGGSSEIIGALFGTESGVATPEVPFYVYACSNVAENDVVFFLSRQRGATVTPVAGDIGDKTTPSGAVTENAFWAIDSITEADFAEIPCIMIGSIAMSKDSSDDWTVTAIDGNYGINRYPKLSGGGVRSYYYKASDFDVIETNFAPLNQDNGSTARILSRAFDDTIEEFVNFSFQCPPELDLTGMVTFRVWMYAATAVASRFVQLTFDHRVVDNSESWDGAYTSVDSGDLAIDGTQGDITEATWQENISQLGWSPNDLVMARLSRIAPSGTNLSGDLYVVGFSVEIPRS